MVGLVRTDCLSDVFIQRDVGYLSHGYGVVHWGSIESSCCIRHAFYVQHRVLVLRVEPDAFGVADSHKAQFYH